jgi:hypothetical protein
MTKKKSTSLPQEVFLLHSSRNRSFASKLAATLCNHGIPVWYSKTNLKGGQQWHDEIGRSLERCDWFAVVLSRSSVKSMWVERELLYALQKTRFQNRIIPIMYRACEPYKLSWTLGAMQKVDFRNDFDSGCNDLLRIWGIGYSSD